MSVTEKIAWFNLSVILVTLVAVAVLYPFLGGGALGGTGLLGFLGLSPLLFRRRNREIVADERDIQIQLRSVVVAYSIFWVVFVLAGSLAAPYFYGFEGSIPVPVVQASVLLGFVLFISLMSIGTLLNYRGRLTQ